MKTKYPRHMPFMYNVYSSDIYMEYKYTLVKIGLWDMVHYSHDWWGDSKLKGKTILQPDIDLAEEEHRFDSEEEALDFIKDWYKSQ